MYRIATQGGLKTHTPIKAMLKDSINKDYGTVTQGGHSYFDSVCDYSAELASCSEKKFCSEERSTISLNFPG